MYFTISPSFYYMANESSISAYLSIELGGVLPYMSDKETLAGLIHKYISKNSHGVDPNKVNQYVEYICAQLVLNSWNNK